MPYYRFMDCLHAISDQVKAIEQLLDSYWRYVIGAHVFFLLSRK
jgi:hypothetical protein